MNVRAKWLILILIAIIVMTGVVFANPRLMQGFLGNKVWTLQQAER